MSLRARSSARPTSTGCSGSTAAGRPGLGPPLDQSVDGVGRFGTGSILELVDPRGDVIEVELPDGWPGPAGVIELSHDLSTGLARAAAGPRADLARRPGRDGSGLRRGAWRDADQRPRTGRRPDQPGGRRTAGPARASTTGRSGSPDHPADWTLLVTSGEHGDKLPIGFRGCHAALEPGSLEPCLQAGLRPAGRGRAAEPAGGPLSRGPRAPGPALRPGDAEHARSRVPVSRFAGSIDLLCCNRREWETLDDREEVAWRVSILVVTDGPAGASARFTQPRASRGSSECRLSLAHARRATPTGRAKRSRRPWWRPCSPQAGIRRPRSSTRA